MTPALSYKKERAKREYYRRLEAFTKEVEAQLYDRGYDWEHARRLTRTHTAAIEREYCNNGDPYYAAKEVAECQ